MMSAMFKGASGGADMAHSILRLPEVIARTGLSRSTIYLRMKHNAFPPRISLGGRAVGWLDEDIDGWLQDRIEESRSTC